jgi:hypothetical protein
LIAEQLQAARAAHWRQQNNPLLTLEDAERWLAQHPLCLFLPRRAQLPAPAPSFVEACLGSTQATPDPAAIEHAQALLARLTAAGTVVPLNLLGTASEQPDFLATREALPFVISLRAEADWKRAPQTSSGRRVSPLVIELWKLLDEKGSLTAEQARDALGRELTEAAVLRALAELWQGLRISPVYGEQGQPARWEMMQLRHKDALTTAAGTGQVTALSLLVSMYLQSVYAATSEEIEIFLSPAASRSRAREAVRGLSATRQIHSLSMGAQTYYFLKDGLPEFATVVVAEAEEPAAELPAARPRKREHPLTPPPGAIESKPETRPEAPAARGGWQRPQRAGGEKFRPRPQGDERHSAAAGGPRPWRPKETADPSAPLRSGRDDKEREARPGGFRRAATSPRPGASGEGRPPFKPRSGPPRTGGAPPRREGSEGRPSFKPRSGPPRTGGAPPRREGSEGRPSFKPRSGPPRTGGAPPRREGSEGRPSFKPRSGPPRTGGAPPRRDSGEGRPPFKPRSGPPRAGGAPPRREGSAGRPPFKPRSGPPRAGGAPPRREGGAGRPPFKPRSGPPRAGGAPPRRDSGEGRPPFKPRSGPPRAGGAPRREGGAGRPPFKPRSGPPRAGGAPRRESGEGRPPFKPRSGPPRAGGAPRRESGPGRPPFKPRSGPPGAGGAPPRREGSQGRPGGAGRPPYKRPGPPKSGPRSNRPGRPSTPRKRPDA